MTNHEARSRRDESAVVPVSSSAHFNVETAAQMVHSVSSTIIFGMLQTEAYAHAIIETRCPDELDDVVAERMRLRMNRQRRPEQRDPAQFAAIIDERTLRRRVRLTPWYQSTARRPARDRQLWTTRTTRACGNGPISKLWTARGTADTELGCGWLTMRITAGLTRDRAPDSQRRRSCVRRP
jgi:hypothetical protein